MTDMPRSTPMPTQDGPRNGIFTGIFAVAISAAAASLTLEQFEERGGHECQTIQRLSDCYREEFLIGAYRSEPEPSRWQAVYLLCSFRVPIAITILAVIIAVLRSY